MAGDDAGSFDRPDLEGHAENPEFILEAVEVNKTVKADRPFRKSILLAK